MVSKLLLAVVENYVTAIEQGTSQLQIVLKEHFHEIRDGLGINSDPESYGAFPVDPYSHTPAHKGAQQPGMTGQVKEDILSRIAEVGIRIVEGKVLFETSLWDHDELLKEPMEFRFVNVAGEFETIQLAENQFAFTFCQVPVVYSIGEPCIKVTYANGESARLLGVSLPVSESKALFDRDSSVVQLEVFLSSRS